MGIPIAEVMATGLVPRPSTPWPPVWPVGVIAFFLYPPEQFQAEFFIGFLEKRNFSGRDDLFETLKIIALEVEQFLFHLEPVFDKLFNFPVGHAFQALVGPVLRLDLILPVLKFIVQSPKPLRFGGSKVEALGDVGYAGSLYFTPHFSSKGLVIKYLAESRQR